MGKFSDFLKNFFLFQEPQRPAEQFILKEVEGKNVDKPVAQEPPQSSPEKKVNQTQAKPNKPDAEADKKNELKKPVKVEEKSKKEESKPAENPAQTNKVSSSLEKNLDYIKDKYSIPLSTDVMIRDFDISLEKKTYKAFIVFIDGMTDKSIINLHILQPLMLYTSLEKSGEVEDIMTYIERNLVTQNQLKKVDDFNEILVDINFGSCALFVDGATQALILDVKAWEHRTVNRPSTEITIRGPQESFSEAVRVNTALIRSFLKNENIVTESLTIGKRSRTPCSIMYLKNLANPDLVKEVKRRLGSLNIDYATDSGIIEQLIEDNPFMSSPHIISTERPDRVASYLTEGKVAIIIDGSPFALVVPATLFELLHSPEDTYMRFPYVNLIRLIRYLGLFLALLLPGMYIAITLYHQEMIPTDLLLAISAAREKVPFPAIIEILIMEVSFELIREAGIRMPAPIGPTIGIIGALILGQAAVSANIVSPILIIIVAVTGLGSLGMPSFSLSIAFRLLRFAYIALGALAGLLGITLGVFVHGLFLVHQKSFGVPFLSPIAPKTSGVLNDVITRAPIWMQEERPDYMNPLDKFRQPKISRGWTKTNEKGDKQQ